MSPCDDIALALTVHDPDARVLPGVERAGTTLGRTFGALALNATDKTHPHVLDAMRSTAGAVVQTHEAGDVVGRSRRDAVALALRSGCARVLHCDLDHMLRWVEAAPGEIGEAAASAPAADFLIIGRTPSAFARSPARLRETEALVNRVYELATGRAADVMFAIRLMTRAAATAVVEKCTEDTIANDVEWPLVLEHEGFTVDYFAANGLDYRVNADFDADDSLDHDPRVWIERIEIAALHARTIRRLIAAR